MIYTVAHGVDDNFLANTEKWLVAIPMILALVVTSAIILLRPTPPSAPDTGDTTDTSQTDTTPSVRIQNTSSKHTSSDSGNQSTGQTNSSSVARAPHETTNPINTSTAAVSVTRSPSSPVSGSSPTATSTATSSFSATSGSDSTSIDNSSATLPLTICIGSEDMTTSGSLLEVSSDHLCIN